jgi:uncharacterized protein
MTSHYRDLLFGASVKAAQEALGSRRAYARGEGANEHADRLTENEVAFLSTRDSFYMATTGADGWPYIQHRGGAKGFIKIPSDRAFAFPDFRGNRQYISLGNLADDNRAAFFFMDYPRRARLKLLGRVRAVDLGREPELAALLVDGSYDAVAERAFWVDIEAFEWNCRQHIAPRFTLDEIVPAIDGLKQRIAELEAELAGERAARAQAG